jgi:RecA/RadA recombinase
MPFNVPKKKQDTKELISDIKDTIENGELTPIEQKPIEWDKVPIISTGSTLLDLTISGGKTYEGGIPASIFCEVHGPPGSGKTAILSTVGANAQLMGGDMRLQDPESRTDQEYARIYEIALDKTNYSRPARVEDIFEVIKTWDTPKKPKVLLTDSLAALTTQMEQDDKDGMSQQRAKQFHKGFRTNARIIAEMLWLCSNQEIDGPKGMNTPGGNAIKFYASLRIRLHQVEKIEVKKENKYGVKVTDIIGIESECFVTKSTVDDPYRSCPICIVFGLGLDDVRANLQYLKDMQKLTGYPTPDGKKYMGMDQAILHIEENGMQKALRDQTIIMWHEIQELFKFNRSRKKIHY